MPNNSLTFEQIDALMKRVNVADYQAGGKSHLTAAAAQNATAALPQQFCTIYKAVRPVLEAVLLFPLIPEQWKAVIKAFIGILDTLCPQ